MNERDVIIAGIPRSGTTLVCALLNKLPDAVALNEPLIVSHLPKDRAAACDKITRYFAKTRDKIERKGTVRALQHDGEMPSNNFTDEVGERGIREPVVTLGRVRITKPVSAATLICLKHPSLFTVLLEELMGQHRCFAVIRNPLATLASWHSVDVQVRRGRLPGVAPYDPALIEKVEATEDVVDRQLVMLSWHFERYRELLPGHALLRYEDIVASGGRSLRTITKTADRLDEALPDRNGRYDPVLLCSLGQRLLRSDGAYWAFYSKESVQALLP